MSLLQEMEKHGLADCEFNRKLLQQETERYKLFKATYQSMLYKLIKQQERAILWKI
jgi:hypothetical protein